MTLEGPKTPHRLRQRLMEVADTVPEERFADFSRSMYLKRYWSRH